MKKIGQIGLKIIIIIMIFLTASTINHKIQLHREREMKIPSKLVLVNGHKMNVHLEGKGDELLVFLAGSGTCSPVLDFKTLYSQLTDHYRIAVIEKAGYGYSEVADVPRDINTILNESRTALSLAGESGPYILVPHSMSGLEALYWAQNYPEEVKAIIGLDPTVPPVYDEIKMPSNLSFNIQYFAARTGVLRFLPGVYESSAAVKYGNLTKEEKQIYKGLIYEKTLTKNMKEEVEQAKNNEAIVEKGSIPKTIPMLFFISSGKQLGSENWSEMLTDYSKQLENGQYRYVEAGHYMHDEIPDTIAAESIKFIEQLKQK